MVNKVEICGVNTAKLPLYKEAEMMQMIEKIQAGDKQARDEFIQGNLRLVLSVIQRFSNRGENPDDLFQVGCIGLIKALDNFDLSHGVKFSTYAVPMIIGEIRRYLRDNNTIRVSRSMRDLAYKALQTKEQLSGSLQTDGDDFIRLFHPGLRGAGQFGLCRGGQHRGHHAQHEGCCEKQRKHSFGLHMDKPPVFIIFSRAGRTG